MVDQKIDLLIILSFFVSFFMSNFYGWVMKFLVVCLGCYCMIIKMKSSSSCTHWKL